MSIIVAHLNLVFLKIFAKLANFLNNTLTVNVLYVLLNAKVLKKMRTKLCGFLYGVVLYNI